MVDLQVLIFQQGHSCKMWLMTVLSVSVLCFTEIFPDRYSLLILIFQQGMCLFFAVPRVSCPERSGILTGHDAQYLSRLGNLLYVSARILPAGFRDRPVSPVPGHLWL